MASGKKGAFNKIRFIWKADIIASADLSQGAKVLAACLCDSFVNRDTGRCWPKDDTLSSRIGKSPRCVQRYLNELKGAGWLQPVKQKGARRAYQICFPNGRHDVVEADSSGESKSPAVSRQPDKIGESYKNQVNNQVNNCTLASPLKYVFVYENEKLCLETWRSWIDANTVHNPDGVLDLLRKGRGYLLPSRYPAEHLDKNYLAFFDAVISSGGKCFEE